MTLEMNRSRLEDLLQRIRSQRIGIVGDFALDGYWYVDMTQAELSRETPLFNHPVVRETYTAGGAANVAANVASLQAGEVWAFSVFGDDWRGRLLNQVLEKEGVRLETITTVAGRHTPFFGKVVLMGWETRQEDARVDFVNSQPLEADAIAEFVRSVEERLPDLDALIIADYLEQGVVGSEVIRLLNQLAKDNPKKVFTVDSRTRIDQFQSMVIKPNEVEASRVFFPDRDPEQIDAAEFLELGKRLQAETGCPAYVTQGKKGALVCWKDKSTMIPAMPVAPPLDTVGAGDTFVAALTAGLSAGASPVEAGELATLASAVTIRKLGMTGTASPEEVMAAHRQYCEAMN